MCILVGLGVIIALAAPAASILIVYRISHENWGILFFENVSAAPGIDASAPCYSSAKNVLTSSIVVSKFELCNIKWVLGTDPVESAYNSALHQRPKTLNRVGVHRTNNIFLVGMPDEGVRKFLV